MISPQASRLAAQEFRRAFDVAFAAAPPPPAPATVALLIVRVGGEQMALRRSDLKGFVQGEHVTPTPGRLPAFVGLAAVRGLLLPVWSLAALLGRPNSTADRWLALGDAGEDKACALACESFEKMIFVPGGAISPLAATDSRRAFTPTVAAGDTAPVPIIDLPALLADLSHRTQPPQPPHP